MRGIRVSEITHQESDAAADSAPAAKRFVHRISPSVIVGVGLGLTAAWVCCLGYGLIILIDLVI